MHPWHSTMKDLWYINKLCCEDSSIMGCYVLLLCKQWNHLQVSSWRWRHYNHSNHVGLFTQWHNVTSHNTQTFGNTAAKTSNLTYSRGFFLFFSPKINILSGFQRGCSILKFKVRSNWCKFMTDISRVNLIFTQFCCSED